MRKECLYHRLAETRVTRASKDGLVRSASAVLPLPAVLSQRAQPHQRSSEQVRPTNLRLEKGSNPTATAMTSENAEQLPRECSAFGLLVLGPVRPSRGRCRCRSS